jgi:hypothetical protein
MLLPLILSATLICAGIILYRYYRIRRMTAGIGWVLIILAIGGFGSGLSQSFSWAGFVFLFIGAVGVLVIIQDSWFRRRAYRTRETYNRSGSRH